VCTTRAGPRENPQFRARPGRPGGAAEAWAGRGGDRGRAVLGCRWGLAAVPAGRWPIRACG